VDGRLREVQQAQSADGARMGALEARCQVWGVHLWQHQAWVGRRLGMVGWGVGGAGVLGGWWETRGSRVWLWVHQEGSRVLLCQRYSQGVDVWGGWGLFPSTHTCRYPFGAHTGCL
jgi:hypothetical protein